MISKDKTYKTRDGREVRIYATDGAGEHPVHGAIKNKFDWWNAWQWTHKGECHLPLHDLIEVKPRHKRTVWINMYEGDGGVAFSSKQAADYCASSRIACIKVDLDFEEGDGL